MYAWRCNLSTHPGFAAQSPGNLVAVFRLGFTTGVTRPSCFGQLVDVARSAAVTTMSPIQLMSTQPWLFGTADGPSPAW